MRCGPFARRPSPVGAPMHAAELCQATQSALACKAGSHALGELAALLAFALSLAGVLAWVANRLPLRQGAIRVPGRAARRERAMFAAIVTGASAFATIAYGIGRDSAFLAADRAFSEAAHAALSTSAMHTFEWITHLGDGTTLALLCAGIVLVLLARGERRLAIGFAAALGGNGLLDGLLKRIFVRVRPPADGVPHQFHGWGFPSGHAAGTLVACGFLTYLALRLLPRRLHAPCVLIATALVLLVGASRIFINAHYASDVLAGFASGAAWLLLCILVIERSRDASPQPRSSGSARSSLSSTSPT